MQEVNQDQTSSESHSPVPVGQTHWLSSVDELLPSSLFTHTLLGFIWVLAGPLKTGQGLTPLLTLHFGPVYSGTDQIKWPRRWNPAHSLVRTESDSERGPLPLSVTHFHSVQSNNNMNHLTSGLGVFNTGAVSP